MQGTIMEPQIVRRKQPRGESGGRSSSGVSSPVHCPDGQLLRAVFLTVGELCGLEEVRSSTREQRG